MSVDHLRLDLDGDGCNVAALLTAAVQSGTAARTATGRSAVTTPMKVHSRKMSSGFAVDSPGEWQAIALADQLEDVVAFRPQAVELSFAREGRMHRAFPDLAVLLLDGSVELWEVKPERTHPGLVRKLALLSGLLRRRGIRYRVRTSTWLLYGSRQENARRLSRLADMPLSEAVGARVAEALMDQACNTAGRLRGEVGAELDELLAAAARGWVAVDIDGGPLGDASGVRPCKPRASSGGYLGHEGGGNKR